MRTLTAAERRDYRLVELAHRRELARRGFTLDTVGNYGAVGTEQGWLSKTRKGILQTDRVAPRRYRHIWSE